MHALRANLRDHATFGLLDDERVEAIGATEQKWPSSDRAGDAAWDVVVASDGRGERGVRSSHRVERKPEHDDAAAIDGAENSAGRDAGPPRDFFQRSNLHRVLALLVALVRPPGDVRSREHGGVLAGAVVMKTCGTLAGLTNDPRAARRERIVRATCEVAFLEPDVSQHGLGERNVLGLATVRGTRERELVVAPADFVEAPAGEKRHDLERLCAGSPHGDGAGVARAPDESATGIHDGRVYAVARLDAAAPSDEDVEVVVVHRGKLTRP